MRPKELQARRICRVSSDSVGPDGAQDSKERIFNLGNNADRRSMRNITIRHRHSLCQDGERVLCRRRSS